MRSGAVLWLVVVCGLGACAIQEPPSGGPPDTRAPQVISTSPADGAAGVATDADIRIAFDEPMSKRGFERFVTTSPRILVGKTGWSKDAFVLQSAEPLHPDTTYIVELKSGYSDRHGVPSKAPFQFAFATSAAIDSGVVRGFVHFRRQPSRKAVLRLFVMPVSDTAFNAQEMFGDRETVVEPDGSFELGYLPTDDRDFLIWAFEDGDDSGSFDPERDVGAAVPDTVSLDEGNPTVDDLRIFIVDPKEPGKISGSITNATGVDSFPVTLALHALADTMPFTYVTRASLDGEYGFQQVLMGSYTMTAFMDFFADSLCGRYPCADDSTKNCIEPCAQYPDTLTIEPGQVMKLEAFVVGSERQDESDKE